MRTFSISILGCRVNHYEGEQIAALLRRRGLQQVHDGADVRVIHTCSVTTEAARKSRQATRRAIQRTGRRLSLPVLDLQRTSPPQGAWEARPGARTIVTGCWATSHPADAAALGADAVLGHDQDVAAKLDGLLDEWGSSRAPVAAGSVGTHALPQLHERQQHHQRAFLKIQDGCDAHCTYCIIPRLRPVLWSRPIDDVVEEARAMVAAGHLEIVLTGIFLGAYGQPTALRRRQPADTRGQLARLVEALCARVPGLHRLRLSSLEPGDLDESLLAVLGGHRQVVPHLHLPLQSGSDAILRRMNRQYRRDDFLRMIEQVRSAFDRPAITTDILVGFPGEGEEKFVDTLQVAEAAGFIHIHAFAFSPRPGTAAARWSGAAQPAIARQRIAKLREMAGRRSLAFRRQFVGEVVELLVERLPNEPPSGPIEQHGRSPWYFPVHFTADRLLAGQAVRVRIDRVTAEGTSGTLLEALDPPAALQS